MLLNLSIQFLIHARGLLVIGRRGMHYAQLRLTCLAANIVFICQLPTKTFRYTYLQNKRMRRCGVAPPHQKFSKDLSYPNKLYIVGKRIYRRVRIIKNIGKIFWFRDFMSIFREIGGI